MKQNIILTKEGHLILYSTYITIIPVTYFMHPNYCLEVLEQFWHL